MATKKKKDEKQDWEPFCLEITRQETGEVNDKDSGETNDKEADTDNGVQSET